VTVKSLDCTPPDHALLHSTAAGPRRQRLRLPLVERVEIACESWESLIGRIEVRDEIFGRSLREFYGKCRIYNGRVERTGVEQATFGG
jgi:hypothetical protein